MKDVKEQLELVLSVTVDDCAITETKEKANWFMNQMEKIFSISRGGEMKKNLGINYKWEVLENGKAVCKETMDKKVDCSVAAYEAHIRKEAKFC